MTHRVLIVDNNSAHACGECYEFHKRVAWPYEVIRPFDGDEFPLPSEFSHVILTGGNLNHMHDTNNWERQLEYVRSRHKLAKPLLGVCLGMEIITTALVRESPLRHRSSSEVGWVRVKRIGESRLLEGLPSEFGTFANHASEVIRLPHGFRAIAKTRRVDIAAIEHRSKPTFGVQFHPEKTPLKTLVTVRRRKRQDIPSRWFIDPYSISHYDRTVGQHIFDNFFAS